MTINDCKIKQIIGKVYPEIWIKLTQKTTDLSKYIHMI